MAKLRGKRSGVCGRHTQRAASVGRVDGPEAVDLVVLLAIPPNEAVLRICNC